MGRSPPDFLGPGAPQSATKTPPPGPAGLEGKAAYRAREQALGGREGHSVLGYLTDGTVWADWLLPGLRDGLGVLFPLIGILAAAGLILCLLTRADPPVRVAAAAGLATALAWLVAPAFADRLTGPGHVPMVKALLVCLTIGLVWQFLLVLALVRKEQGSLRWPVVRDALWLWSPRSPRSGQVGGRVWLVLLPLVALFALEGLLPSPPVPENRDLNQLVPERWLRVRSRWERWWRDEAFTAAVGAGADADVVHASIAPYSSAGTAIAVARRLGRDGRRDAARRSAEPGLGLQ